MYMNILLAQFDMLLVEVASDLLITLFVTRYYLKENTKKSLFPIPFMQPDNPIDFTTS